MATEAARLENQEPTGRKKKNRLDSNRPSHGRTLPIRAVSLVGQAAERSEDPAVGNRRACSSGKVHFEGVNFLCARVAE